MALPVIIRRSRAADPFEMARNNFDEMLSRLFGGTGLAESGGSSSLASLGGYGVDIREDADHIYVEADLPGFKKEEVDISLENGTLTIVAEHREETPAPAPTGGKESSSASKSASRDEYLLRERRIERFVRSFTLPQDVDDKNVVAKLEDGVLKITLDKRHETKPRHVQVS